MLEGPSLSVCLSDFQAITPLLAVPGYPACHAGSLKVGKVGNLSSLMTLTRESSKWGELRAQPTVPQCQAKGPEVVSFVRSHPGVREACTSTNTRSNSEGSPELGSTCRLSTQVIEMLALIPTGSPNHYPPTGLTVRLGLALRAKAASGQIRVSQRDNRAAPRSHHLQGQGHGSNLGTWLQSRGSKPRQSRFRGLQSHLMA